MAQKPANQEMEYQFRSRSDYNPQQQSILIDYQNLFNVLDMRLESGPEKSVAMRKLLESMDAAMRCLQY